VADVFLGGLFFHSFSCCLRSIVVVKFFRWARCIFDVGGESGIFVGGNMVKAVHFFARVCVANVLSSLGDYSGGLGVSSMYVARAVYLLGATILMLLFANFFFKDLLVFFPRTSIHFSSSEPPRRHSLLVMPLSLSLPLLLSPDMLLANPPIPDEYSCRRLNLTPNSLQILLGCHPLYFLL